MYGLTSGPLLVQRNTAYHRTTYGAQRLEPSGWFVRAFALITYTHERGTATAMRAVGSAAAYVQSAHAVGSAVLLSVVLHDGSATCGREGRNASPRLGMLVASRLLTVFTVRCVQRFEAVRGACTRARPTS